MTEAKSQASMWQAAHHSSRHEERFDLVVVGGGIAGIATALWAGRSGMRVALLEGEQVASGASGRNAGYLMRGAAENFYAAAREWGEHNAAAVWRLTERNLELLRGEGIGQLDSVRDLPSVLAATSEEEESELLRSAEMLRDAGFDVALDRNGADALWQSGAVRCSLVNPADAVCNPVELLSYLRGVFERESLEVTCFEGVRVTGIRATDQGVTVNSPAGSWTGSRAVFSVGAHRSALFPDAARTIEPNRGQVLAVQAPDVVLDAAYYLDHGHEYLRPGPRGTVILGGLRQRDAETERTCELGLNQRIQSLLEDRLAELIGARYPVVHRWSGIMGFTPSGLPVLERLDPAGRAWYFGGFTGHGMSMAFAISRYVAAACTKPQAEALEGTQLIQAAVRALSRPI